MSNIIISDENKTTMFTVLGCFKKYADELNAWQCKFLESIGCRALNNIALTEKQLAKLTEIYNGEWIENQHSLDMMPCSWDNGEFYKD